MLGHNWISLFERAFNSIFFHGKSNVDHSDFSHKEFPALKRLTCLSTLEVLLLSYLIWIYEEKDFFDSDFDFSFFVELFENFDCTTEDISHSLFNLCEKSWVKMAVSENAQTISFSANINCLTKDRLYIPNSWSHLSNLGLYGIRICKN